MSLEKHKTVSAAREKTPDTHEVVVYKHESGTTVELRIATFLNHGTEESSKNATVFLPGWSMSELDQGSVRLCRSFAHTSEGPSFAITARSAERGISQESREFIKEEAVSIAQFIKDRGIRDVILSGHSQGGDRVVHVAAELQKDSEIKVGGLVLIAPIGMYDETVGGRTGTFAKHSLIETPLAVMKSGDLNTIAIGTKVLTESALHIASEVWRSGLTYRARLTSEIEEMIRINPDLAELSMPIILVLGANDPVSDRESIVPLEDERRLRKKLEEDRPEHGKELDQSSRDTTLAAREVFLREHMFPNSPYVRMIVPQKEGWHTLVHFRPESIARASLYLLKRHTRTGQSPKE